MNPDSSSVEIAFLCKSSINIIVFIFLYGICISNRYNLFSDIFSMALKMDSNHTQPITLICFTCSEEIS